MTKRKNHETVTTKKKQMSGKMLRANKKYKDTVFRMLFSDRENLLSLYNAINGTTYENPEALEIVTLENAIYMGMKNDLAFIVDTNLFLYEHQSTYNPNMPLRDLLYISSEYQKLVDHRSLYPSILQKIPAPNFIVFYNETRKKEDRWENLLPEAFEHLEGKPNLELRVVTLNINENHNRELMEQCKILREEEEEKKLREAEYEAGYDSGRQDGLTEGELRKAKETAAELAKLGMASTQIADVLKQRKQLFFNGLRNAQNNLIADVSILHLQSITQVRHCIEFSSKNPVSYIGT